MLVGALPPANLVKALPQVILYASTVSLVAQMVKNPPTMLETWVFDPWVGKIPEEGKGFPLQHCGLENSMDCIVHGVEKSRTQLSDFQSN